MVNLFRKLMVDSSSHVSFREWGVKASVHKWKSGHQFPQFWCWQLVGSWELAAHSPHSIITVMLVSQPLICHWKNFRINARTRPERLKPKVVHEHEGEKEKMMHKKSKNWECCFSKAAELGMLTSKECKSMNTGIWRMQSSRMENQECWHWKNTKPRKLASKGRTSGNASI